MAHDVFVSYSAEDKSIADAVCATLEAKRIRCWIAPRDILPGAPYAEALVDAIDGSRLMVLVFSSKSNSSPHVMREVERAVSRGLPVIPLRIEDVVPSKSMEFFISSSHWRDALTPPMEAHLDRLAGTVQLLVARMGPAAGPPTAVPEPPAREAEDDAEVAEVAPTAPPRTVEVEVFSPVGDRRVRLKVPTHWSCSRLAAVLVEKIAPGSPLPEGTDWALMCKRMGRVLTGDDTLAAAGVGSGDTLRLCSVPRRAD